MNKAEELAHLHAPFVDPKQRMIDYWGRRAEIAEDKVQRLTAALDQIAATALDAVAVQIAMDALAHEINLMRRPRGIDVENEKQE